jgi:hypothetical protein
MRRDHLFGRLSRREPRPVAGDAPPQPPEALKPAVAEPSPVVTQEPPEAAPQEAPRAA